MMIQSNVFHRKLTQFKRTPKRGLTRHVVTRWYIYLPELIANRGKNYDEEDRYDCDELLSSVRGS